VAPASAAGDVVFRGHGWGHGTGLSQFGAEGAAKLGCTYPEILGAYYPGSRVVAAPMPDRVQLRLLDGGSRVDVRAETAALRWELVDCSTACPPAQPKGSLWQLRVDQRTARYQLRDPARPAAKAVVWTGGSASQELRLRHSAKVVRLTTWKGSSVFLDRRLQWDYTRFSVDLAQPTRPTLDAVQAIVASGAGSAMDKYLWGIAEVPATFPAEALKAQAVAARTYAGSPERAGRILLPTPEDQNYTGFAKESESTPGTSDRALGALWRAAVDATSGQVLKTAAGAWVDALYSSSFGGHSEDGRYVWGADGPPLRAVDDTRWELASSNPPEKRAWAVPMSWAVLTARLRDYGTTHKLPAMVFDEISSVSVPARGTKERLAGVRVRGVKAGRVASVTLEGWDVREALGLLSPGFTVATRTIGGAGAQPLSGDWDGDGRDEPGWFRDGEVAVRLSRPGGAYTKRFRFGQAGDVAVVGDWDRDGDDDIGVFRAGSWFLRNGLSGGTSHVRFRFGRAGDQPVVGRWSRRTPGVGVFRDGTWLLHHGLSAGRVHGTIRFGAAGDVAVVGDWDGDGDTNIGVFRGGRWAQRNTMSPGRGDQRFTYGRGTDRPVAGDWDGDRRATVGVQRGPVFHQSGRNGPRAPSRRLSFVG
jgi:SpoIID/LytB domain protein